MIQTKVKYLKRYLDSLRPINDGGPQRKVYKRVLDDGNYRVWYSKTSGRVQIQCRHFETKWDNKKNYKARKEPFLTPSCTGLSSEPKQVAKRLTELLTALSRINGNICETGDMLVEEMHERSFLLKCQLIADGWRMRNTTYGWKIMEPLKGKRNDNA